MSKVVSAEIFETVEISAIPDGNYPGIWGGYQVVVMIGGRQFRMHTDNGIRCTNCPCEVRVSNGKATVVTT